jgi:cell division protein FtsZ
MGVRGVTDLMVMPGIVNLDFADVRSVMREMGKAMMGTGEAEGEDRAIRAAEAAISNPLLEDTNMKGARGLLINITGGSDVTLFEIDQAANRVSEEVDTDANIMFGMSLDETMSGRIRVSVVATGIDSVPISMPNLKVVNGGAESSHIVQAVATQNAQQQAVTGPAGSTRPAGYVPEPPSGPLVSKAFVERGYDAAPAVAEASASTEALTAPRPVAPVRPAAMAPSPSPVRAPEPPKTGSIFKSVFGFGVHKPAAPAPQQHRQEPAMRVDEASDAPRAAVRQAQVTRLAWRSLLSCAVISKRRSPAQASGSAWSFSFADYVAPLAVTRIEPDLDTLAGGRIAEAFYRALPARARRERKIAIIASLEQRAGDDQHAEDQQP